jgi:hypothetical protein
MSIAYLFDKVGDLKEKFKRFFQQHKKIKALDNFSSVVPFSNKVDEQCFKIVKSCFDYSFLDDEQERFLTHMLSKLEINYLDWAHKTKWLKEQIAARQDAQRASTQQLYFFDLDKLRNPTLDVPIEILTQVQSGIGARL